MIKKILCVGMMLICLLGINAQMPQLTPLPLNPKVKAGVLPNGLSYYIMHNEEPKERANFYIAQKVGSTLEEQDQLGLAHFLEHMAFNGTKNYPGKSMLDYLRSKGIRFGADINAYTSFDETVYNINNVPTTDKNLLDSVLLVLHDWSGDILLEESEIDAERGVIQEEWRQRNDAQTRMYTAILPQIYEEYQYEQMPIGKMEVVMNFKPEVLRAYYKKWYRPDQQGIVIVGDIDADEMEKKVVELFSSIEMPANVAERVYPTVSDNEKPIYVAYTDPELNMPRTTISFKSEKVPFEMRNTFEIYAMQDLPLNIITGLMNNRLEDFSHDPDCNYAMAGVYFGDFYVSKTKDSFNVVVIPKKGTDAAVADAMGIVARACQTGFTDSELERVRQDLLSNIEKLYNERDKTDNESLARELCRHFIDNEPAPGIEKEYEIYQQIIPNLPVDAINMMIKQLLTSQNMVIVTAEPQKEGFEIVAEDVMVKTVTDAMNAQYEAFVDEVITEPLIANLPTPGKVVSQVSDNALGTETFTLSNGIKVMVKTTDFAADEILMTAFRRGGKEGFSIDRAADVLLLDDAFESSKMGPFDAKTLRKYLAGKNVRLGFSVGNYLDELSGSSTVKDLPVLMELLYTAFTNLNPDQDTYNVNMDQARTVLNNADKNPQKIFMDQLAKVRFGNNPLMYNATVATIDAAKYDEMFKMLKEVLSNPADYTFLFTGNVDTSSLKPLLEQYVASLPVAEVKKFTPVTEIATVKGDVIKEFKQQMQSPSTFVFDIYSDYNVPFNNKNSIMIEMIGDILDNIYIETLREEEGGTYGASVGGNLNPVNGMWQILYFFQTNKDQQQTLINRAQSEWMKLLSEGAGESDFNKVKEAMIKQYEINVRTNKYWQNSLELNLRGYDTITGYEDVLKSVTLSDLNSFMKSLYNGKNRIQVIMEGVAEN